MTLTSLDMRAVREAFDRAATAYDQHAVLQHEVERRLLERVAYFDLEPQTVLDLGCGTGIGSRSLAKQFPSARVIGVDWSQAMLGQAKPRPGHGKPRQARSSPLGPCGPQII